MAELSLSLNYSVSSILPGLELPVKVCTYSVTDSLNRYLLRTHCMPGMVLGLARNRRVQLPWSL